ncbi:MAG TPA: hypothetical protein PKA61_07645 [Nitrospira sp.]|nr:hypothetical protein [Nitrospira sp.]
MAENRELALVLKLVADQFQSELKKSQGVLSDFNGFIKDWKTQLTAAGAALFAIAKSTANYGDELVKASQRMGTSVEDTARLQHAAKLSDTDLQGLSKTVGFLSKEMLAASSGNVDAQKTFDRLGISVVTSNGQLKGTTQVLLEMNDKFRLMPDGPEKTAMAMLSLGKTGKDVLPLLNSNMREAFDEADKLGLVMSEKDARAAEHFNDELTKLHGAIRGVTNDIGSALIPKFDAISHALTTIVTDAHAAATALAGLNKVEAPQVGVVKPSEGGRNLRILPAPPGADNAQVEKFFPTEADEAHAAFLRELDRYQKNLQNKEIDIISKRTMEDLHLLFAGANSMRQEVQSEVDRLIQELIDDNARTIEQINQDFSGDTHAERQEAAGRRIVERSMAEFQQKQQQELVDNLQAWRTYYDQVGGSAEFRYTNEMNLLRASLAQQLNLTTDQTGRLLIAWQNHDQDLADSVLSRTTLTEQQRETIMLQSLTKIAQANEQVSDDIFAGWAKGLQRYIKDQQTMLGLGADQARRFFQSMEQFSQQFFFDAMAGKINGTKALFASLLSFGQQVTSQLAGQLFTKQLAGAFAGSLPNFFGSPGVNTGFTGDLFKPLGAASGGMIQRFASGGPVLGTGNRDTVPALLTPGEFVLSRRDVSDIKAGVGGSVSIVVNNYGQSEVQTSAQRGPDGRQMIYVTVRDMVKGMIQGGDMDAPFGKRFNLTPSAGRR